MNANVMDSYYILSGREVLGPLRVQDILKLYDSGRISEQDTIARSPEALWANGLRLGNPHVAHDVFYRAQLYPVGKPRSDPSSLVGVLLSLFAGPGMFLVIFLTWMTMTNWEGGAGFFAGFLIVFYVPLVLGISVVGSIIIALRVKRLWLLLLISFLAIPIYMILAAAFLLASSYLGS